MQWLRGHHIQKLCVHAINYVVSASVAISILHPYKFHGEGHVNDSGRLQF